MGGTRRATAAGTILWALACAAVVQADLTPLPPDARTDAVLGATRAMAPADLFAPNRPGYLPGGVDSDAGAAIRFSPAEAGDRDVIQPLPPGPGSAALALFAFGGFGFWHLGRSARKLNLGALPEWYHNGGPQQIGHAVPFDFDFGALPLCCFEQPLGERPFFYHVRRDQAPRRDRQRHLFTTAPRAPPLVC